jgi:TP901 family phage tail tape measure protein
MGSGSVPKSIKATLYIDGKPAEQSIKNLKQVTRGLERDLAQLKIGTDAWNAKMKEVANNKKYLKELRDEVNGVGGAFNRIKSELGSLGTLAAGYLGFQFVEQQFQQIIMTNAKLSDSLADVRKTTGLTENDVLSLSKELSKINTRTSRTELLELATVAGKLGITAKEDVLGFVKASNMIGVALGRDLGNTEDAVNTLGKLTDLFKLKDQFGLELSLTKIGSAINELGAAGTANEAYIVEFAKRLGTIAPAANISIENILGLAATMDELGQPVESAATALSQFIVGMGKDLPTFAALAGLSVKDFSEILRKDGNEALITVLAKLEATGGGVEELASKMGMIGEEGARATAALGALSNNLDKLKTRQKSSNEEFSKGDSLLREYNIKNQNFAATLDKISKWFHGIATSRVITGVLQSAATGFARLIGLSKTYSEELESQRMTLNKLALQIMSTNTKTEDRIKLINQLKSEFPTLLKFLDAEKSSNLEIAKAIKIVNDQLINKIILAKKDQDIEEENQKNARLKISLLEKEDEIREKIIKLSEKFPKIQFDGDTDADKLTDLVSKIVAGREKLKQTSGGVFDPVHGAASLLKGYNVILGAISYSDDKTTLMLNKRNELMKRLGIEDTKIETGNSNSNTVTTEVSNLGTNNLEDNNSKKNDKIIADQQKLRDELAKISSDITKNELEGFDREVYEARLKYQKLEELAHGNKDLIADIYRQEYEEIESIALKHENQAAEKTKKEYEEKLKEFNAFKNKLQNQSDVIDYRLDFTPQQKEEAEASDDYEESWKSLYAYHKAKVITDEQFANIELEMQENLQRRILGIKRKYKENEQQESKDMYLQGAQIVSDAVFSIVSNSQRARTEDALSNLEDQRQQELSKKNLTEAQKKRINDKYDAQARSEKLRSWQAEKRAAIGQAVINGALSVIKALPNVPLAITSGLAAAAQLAVIVAQKPPKFASGGMSDKDPAGYVSSSTLFTNSASGRPFEAGEKGREWIAPNWMVTDPRFSGIINTLEIARKEKRSFASGGFNSNNSNASSPAPIFNGDNGSSRLDRLEAMMERMIIAQEHEASKPVVWSHRVFEEEYARRMQIRNDASS